MSINKVLICDDSSADRTNLQRIISAQGCDVVSASNGREALSKAKAERPDIIFLDIIMPEMDGYETCRLLAADPDTKGIPVIFVTSKGARADRVWAQMQGGKGFVAKPFHDAEILGYIENTA